MRELLEGVPVEGGETGVEAPDEAILSGGGVARVSVSVLVMFRRSLRAFGASGRGKR